MAQIAVFQPAVSHAAIGIGCANRNVVINPERQILPETPRADNREGVWSKKVRPRRETVLREDTPGLLAIQSEVPLVAERDGQVPRNLTWIHSAGERFFLSLRAQKHRRFLYKDFVIFRELEPVLLERFP